MLDDSSLLVLDEDIIFQTDSLHSPDDGSPEAVAQRFYGSPSPPPRGSNAAQRQRSMTCEFRLGLYRPLWNDGPWILWNCPEERQQNNDENLSDLDESEWHNTPSEDAETNCFSPTDTHSSESLSSEWDCE